MKQVIQNMKTGEIKVDNIPEPAIRPGGIIVKNHFSLISSGTEKSIVEIGKMNLLEKARSRPEDVKKIIQEIKNNGFFATYRKVMTKLGSGKPLGYSSAGVVIAVDPLASEFKVGDHVACAGAGYANHADVVFVPKNLAVKVPEEVGLDEAAYTTLGAIAIQGVRQAQPTLGENVVVIGLGLVGLLVVQILRANGCRVFGVDVDPDNVEQAKRIGIDNACERNANVERLVGAFTEGYGADAVIIAAATKSSDPVLLAGQIARDRSRIVMIGATGMNIPRSSYYMKELEFRLSRSYGPGRYDKSYEESGIDYPIGYVRWTENRNMKEFVQLLRAGKVDVRSLTTHRFPIDEASKAYKLISGEKKEKYLGILLEYEDVKESEVVRRSSIERKLKLDSQTHLEATDSFKKYPLTIGFIGAGNFAQSSLLPVLRTIHGVTLKTVCNSSGVTGKTVQQQFGFLSVTTDPNEIMSDDKIGTVFIATRHNLHASLVMSALDRGKNVFVEKPLALTQSELISIVRHYNKAHEKDDAPVLMVGFNRRFAPLSIECKKFFEDTGEPIVLNYRVNAGYIPKNHWTQDPVEGGGRIIGEVCHFLDFIQFVTSSTVERVYADSIASTNSAIVNNDNVNVTLRLKNGSLGIITYLANGDPTLPKERIEITSGKRTAVIDNFQYAYFYENGKERKSGSGKINKGIVNEVTEFMRTVSTDRHCLITFDELVNSSLATFNILTSLSTGEPTTCKSILV
jgi:predicted dehydrogenase/threonine dehydrogenase-like Zn-dependent dehydrogenase